MTPEALTIGDIDERLDAFGQRLRSIRRTAKLSQRQLAEVSGLHRVTINRLEQGTVDVGLVSMWKLAKALAVSTSELAGES